MTQIFFFFSEVTISTLDPVRPSEIAVSTVEVVRDVPVEAIVLEDRLLLSPL